MRTFLLLPALLGWVAGEVGAADPYWPRLESPKLATPQWVGEEGVEAVVILSIDDMRESGKFEQFLRPILERLKRIDGRAPVSIFTNGVDPLDPHLQTWLGEGLSIESHTMDHPCPLLAGGDFEKAKSTVHRNIDLLHTIPDSEPVAFRMPCCDSMNSSSPRFYAEILHKDTEAGNYLQADSSVMHLFTPDDPALPAELISPDAETGGRFEKYVPRGRGFVNYIENYPYPYLVGGRTWELPGSIPSDWEAQSHHGPGNPGTITDLKAAIDCTVLKQGVFTLVFHPHGWIENTQVVELIDHVVERHGSKVKFLNMREAVERLNDNLMEGRSLSVEGRRPRAGRLEDVDGDGYFDVVLPASRRAWLWEAEEGKWREEKHEEPVDPLESFGVEDHENGRRRVDVNGDGLPDLVASTSRLFELSLYDKEQDRLVTAAFGVRGEREARHEIPMIIRADGTNNGAWFRDGWMYVQNEDTAANPGQVERRRLADFLQPLPATNDLTNLKPRSPEESLASMQTRPELAVELVAAEPETMDPVDLAWGPDGRLWVVEMADYPSGLDGKGQAGGRVRFLEDRDGDGRYEHSTLFADRLPYPTGVLPWRGGVLVTAAPEILWLRDTNGDGQADVREVLYDGFEPGNPQHRVNGLRWGLDNWIHVANGDSDGVIRSRKTGETVDIRGRDLRIRPGAGLLQAQSGETQFGRVRDDFGNWFGNNNSNALWHYVARDHYVRRNPQVAPPEVRRMVPEEQGRLQLYPASTTVERFNDFHTANRITSACGTGLYRDTWLGDGFLGNAFLCEPVHNLVVRQVLARSGLSFRSRRAAGEESREFLASRDNWFRPVTAKTGPDGALYVVDMYRHVIEHPEWIPLPWQKRLDLRAGADRGRIYRIVRRGDVRRAIPRVADLEGAELLALLGSRNGPLRDLAHFEILERSSDDEAVGAGLRALAIEASLPEVRVQALSVLAGLGKLSAADLLPLFEDQSPEVRRHAVRLAEEVAAGRELMDGLASRLTDDDPRVRHQVHLSLGSIDHPRAGGLLVQALAAIGEEREDAALMQAGLLSSVTPEVAARAILAHSPEVLGPVFGELISTARAGDGEGALMDLAKRLAHEVEKAERPRVSHLVTAVELARGSPEKLRAVLSGLGPRAMEIALAGEEESVARAVAIDLLGVLGGESGTLSLLIARPEEAPDIQDRAIRAFCQSAMKQEARALLQKWAAFPPSVRRGLIEGLLGRDHLAEALVDAARAEESIRRAFVPADLERLRMSRNTTLQKAVEVFGQRGMSAVSEQLKKLQSAATLKGDPGNGRTLFGTHCATCHRLEGAGHEVGPDLAALTNRGFHALLTAIVDPNAAVEDKYLGYTVTSGGGETLMGTIHAETATSLVLRQPGGGERTVLRREVRSLVSTEQSLMPEGYGASLKPQEIADLVSYLREMRSPPKSFEGNEPALIVADSDGLLVLPATRAAIYGPRLVFGQQYRILEYWESEHDYAVWQIDVKRAGVYRVDIELGCVTGVENRLQVIAGDQSTSGVVPQTASWTDFQRRDFGTLTLSAGKQEVIVRSKGPVNKFLVDVREVFLTPQ